MYIGGFGFTSCEAHKLLVHFGWITWAGRKAQRFVFSPGPSFREGFLILGLTHVVSIGSIGCHVVVLMLRCLLPRSHADIPESSICYTGALLESVICTGKEV